MTIVYSTETARIKQEEEKLYSPKVDCIVRIQSQTKGSKCKGVGIVSALDRDYNPLKLIAAEIKNEIFCSCKEKY
ncbi:stress response translation initiation inhibitor YciH, partial [Vibrio parahaemolyticus]|nr:stress response translation initiation inhibitor YciH [Vibrio parahaemolyticus]